MASAISSCAGQGGGMDQNTNKKPPLIHDQLHQIQRQKQCPEPNVFSIDRTFSASSTDIQPSFDAFDEEDENDSQSEFYQKTKKTKFGASSHAKGYNSRRPDFYRKEKAFYRRYDGQHQPKYEHNSDGQISSGNFNPSTKPQKMSESEKRRCYFIEGEDSSIGVPSDISGMLHDSEVMEDEGKAQSNENSSNNKNSTESLAKGYANCDKYQGVDNDSKRNHNNNDDSGNSFRSSEGGDRNPELSKPAGITRNNTKSSIISDGKFGSVSVSSSFSSAAAAAIASGYNGANNNNDIFNERLERFQRYTRGPYAPLDRCNSTSVSSAHSSTITQNYYPEAGYGYVVLVTAVICHALMYGLHLSAGIFILDILSRYGEDLIMSSVWLVSFSMGTSLFLSPIWVAICKRRSTRLTAVFGGLVTSLACLFTSFASQFHQTFISFGIILSIGIGLSRDASYLMVGQYFKRRRDFVEVFLVAGSGLGILVMGLAVHGAISGLGWRFGLQSVTAAMFMTFFLGTCYRSASLYHPQRRAILHLKNQKRKIKEKGKRNDKVPFLDFSSISNKIVQLLIFSTAFTAFGCYSPLFHLAYECKQLEMPTAQMLYLYLYIGAAWILGSCLFGMTVVQRNEDCRISKAYLLQGSVLIIGGAVFALATLHGNHGLGSFCWIYGFGLGSYNYVLKAWTYEKTRAKNFCRAWSFVQCAQGFGCIFGIPATGYMNLYVGWRSGYFMSSASILFSALIMFCCGMRRRTLMRNKSGTSSMKTCETFDSSGMQSPTARRISFTFPDEPVSPRMLSKGSNRSGTGSASGASTDRQSCSGSINSFNGNTNSSHGAHQQPLLLDQPQARMPKELTCISEEGVEPHGHV